VALKTSNYKHVIKIVFTNGTILSSVRQTETILYAYIHLNYIMERSNLCMERSNSCMGRSDFNYGAKWLWLGRNDWGRIDHVAKWPDTKFTRNNEYLLSFFIWQTLRNTISLLIYLHVKLRFIFLGASLRCWSFATSLSTISGCLDVMWKHVIKISRHGERGGFRFLSETGMCTLLRFKGTFILLYMICDSFVT